MQNIITLIFLTILMAPGGANARPFIGYGSSDAVLPGKNQELFYMGFELGLKNAIGKEQYKEYVMVKHVKDGSQAGAIRSARSLMKDGARVLVGFPTSHEAVLVGGVAQKKRILSIFSGAGHGKLAKMGNTVFTTGESMRFSVESMLNIIDKVGLGKKKGLAVINPKAVFSVNQGQMLDTLSSEDNSAVSKVLSVVQLTDKLTLPTEAIGKIQSKEISYLYVTAYADESVALLTQLNRLNLDIPIIANTSWTTGDVEFLRRLLVSRKSITYSASLWLKGSSDSKPFERAVKNVYGRAATAEMAYGYDLGVIVAETLERSRGNLSSDNLIKAFKMKPCFLKGLASGKICFEKTGGHAQRTIYPVVFKKDKFVSLD